MGYLERFRGRLQRRWRGSLVSVSEAEAIDANAKKYASELASRGDIERVTWGWYWIPAPCAGLYEFLALDRHFKVLHKQSAAAFWNGDFIHRNVVNVGVGDPSYGRALEAFAASRGWHIQVETRTFDEGSYRRVDGFYVQELEECIVECVKEWAFADAFASLLDNYEDIDWERIERHYWERIPRTTMRVGQVIKTAAARMLRGGSVGSSGTRVHLSDSFTRRQVEEALDRVMTLG